MNHITVVAHGSHGSFSRRVQEDPTIATDLLHALAVAIAEHVTDTEVDFSAKAVQTIREAIHRAGFARLGGLETGITDMTPSTSDWLASLDVVR